jgi:hypothetical protein
MARGHIAGIRCIVTAAEVGSWNSYAVISPVIDPHVIPTGHMAFDTVIAITGLTFIDFFMEMMIFGIVDICPVAVKTKVISLL